MTFKAFIFDLDGTLVDSYPAIQESLNVTLRELGMEPVDRDTVKRMVGRGVDNLMQQAVGPDRWREAAEVFRRSYDETHLRGTFLLGEVKETLQELNRRGAQLAVASNKPPAYTRNILRHLQVDRYLVDCFGPGEGIPPKPDPAMLQSVLSRLGVDCDSALYVGDMSLDVESARNAGIRVALIPTGGHPIEELLNAGADFLLDRFSNLLKL